MCFLYPNIQQNLMMIPDLFDVFYKAQCLLFLKLEPLLCAIAGQFQKQTRPHEYKKHICY